MVIDDVKEGVVVLPAELFRLWDGKVQVVGIGVFPGAE
jgi:hypothetical protein